MCIPMGESYDGPALFMVLYNTHHMYRQDGQFIEFAIILMAWLGSLSWRFTRISSFLTTLQSSGHHPLLAAPTQQRYPIQLTPSSSFCYMGYVMAASLQAFSLSVLPGLCLLPLCGPQPTGFICNEAHYLLTLTPSPHAGLEFRLQGGQGSVRSSCVALIHYFSGPHSFYLSSEGHLQFLEYSTTLTISPPGSIILTYQHPTGPSSLAVPS